MDKGRRCKDMKQRLPEVRNPIEMFKSGVTFGVTVYKLIKESLKGGK